MNNNNYFKGIRKNFDKNGGVICKSCFERDLIIDKLREELKTARSKINSLEKKSKKVTHKDINNFSHLPSSWQKFKSNSSEENRKKVGGAKNGHKGYGRKQAHFSEQILQVSENCPDCQVPLHVKDLKKRTIVDSTAATAKRSTLKYKRGQCPCCKKIYKPTIQVLPKALYGNRVLSQSIVNHFVHGISIGKIIDILGEEVKKPGLINSFQIFGDFCKKSYPVLIDEIKKDLIINADETGWRTDGQSGYAWIFRSENTTVFKMSDSRGSKVALEILGDKPLEGCLIRDRYAGYNKIKIKTQYCYAHLLREIAKIGLDFLENKECQRFSKKMCSLLKEAMNLQKLTLTELQYLSLAKSIKSSIIKEINYPYEHVAIIRLQNIFKKHKDKMYQWVENTKVPADNNRAEREIRSTVIARKTSFGSQSTRGADARSYIMSLLFTVKKRLKNKRIDEWLFEALNEISMNPNIQLSSLIPKPPQ